MTDQKNNSAQEQYDNRWDYILNREAAELPAPVQPQDNAGDTND